MSKILIFLLLWRLLGNPVLAVLVLLIIFYFLDRRFIGILPSIGRPFKRMRVISKLRQQIGLSPHDVSAKRELARLLIERKSFTAALKLLEEVLPYSEESAEFWADYGLAALGKGDLSIGEERILKAFSINERVRYGQPYLKLAAALKSADSDKAISYAEAFRRIQSSSSEAYYLLGSVYQSLGRKKEAKAAYEESIDVYRQLPKYRRRQERGWAFKSRFRKMTL